MEFIAQFDLVRHMPLLRWLVPLAMALLIIFVTVELIRRRKLREEYAMLWLGASAVLLVFAIFPDLLLWLSRELSVNYLTLVVLALFTFLAMIVMHFAVVISKQTEEIRQLAQQLALMNQKIEKKEPPTTQDNQTPINKSQTNLKSQ